jgi:hypothetical protein
MPGVLAWLHSLQRGLRTSFPSHILGEPMTDKEIDGRIQWL